MTQLEDGSVEIAGTVYKRYSSEWMAYQLGVAQHIISTLLEEKEKRRYLPKDYDKERARKFLKLMNGSQSSS